LYKKKAAATPLEGAPPFSYFQIVTPPPAGHDGTKDHTRGYSKQVVLLCGHRKKFV